MAAREDGVKKYFNKTHWGRRNGRRTVGGGGRDVRVLRCHDDREIVGQYRSEISGRAYGVWRFDDYQLFTTLRPCDLNAEASLRPTRLRTYIYTSDRKGGWAKGSTAYWFSHDTIVRFIDSLPPSSPPVGTLWSVRRVPCWSKTCAHPTVSRFRTSQWKPTAGNESVPGSTKTSRCRLGRGPNRNPTTLPYARPRTFYDSSQNH